MDKGTDAPAPKVVRDVRVDTIGFLSELEKLKKPIVDGVKATMAEKEAAVAEGDVFRAALAGGEPARVVDPQKWHKLFQLKRITKAQFFAALSVSVEHAESAIGADGLATICDQINRAPSLRPVRLKKEPANPLQAARALASQLAEAA